MPNKLAAYTERLPPCTCTKLYTRIPRTRYLMNRIKRGVQSPAARCLSHLLGEPVTPKGEIRDRLKHYIHLPFPPSAQLNIIYMSADAWHSYCINLRSPSRNTRPTGLTRELRSH